MKYLTFLFTANINLLAFFAALGLYAVKGSPTPDSPGLTEIAIGGLLAIAAIPMIRTLYREGFHVRNLWQGAGFILLIYGLTGAMASAFINHNGLPYMVRDIIPFLFLFLPLFYMHFFYESPARGRALIIAAMAMGTLFSLRALTQTLGFLNLNFSGAEELYYLANAPTVLFAACLSFYGMLYHATARLNLRAGLIAIGFLVLFIICTSVMALTLQRASLGALTLYGLVVVAIFTFKRPVKTLVIIAVTAIIFAPILMDLSSIFDALVEKTQRHGLNNRVQEWQAVWEIVAQSWQSLIFGQGWGTTFNSPAVAGVRVNFTHSLLSSMLLKTGLAGLILTILYLAGFAQMLWASLQRDPKMALAMAGPFLIDILLYGSYKSLDFGILLLLVPVTLLSCYATKSECKDDR